MTLYKVLWLWLWLVNVRKILLYIRTVISIKMAMQRHLMQMKWAICASRLFVDILHSFLLASASLYVLHNIYSVELISITKGKDHTKERLEAFKYFIGVVESPPNYDEYEEFKSIVNEYLEKPPFSFQTPFKVNKTIEKRVSSILLEKVILCLWYNHIGVGTWWGALISKLYITITKNLFFFFLLIKISDKSSPPPPNFQFVSDATEPDVTFILYTSTIISHVHFVTRWHKFESIRYLKL